MRNQIRLSRDAAASRQVATDEVGEENPIWFAGGSAHTIMETGIPIFRQVMVTIVVVENDTPIWLLMLIINHSSSGY